MGEGNVAMPLSPPVVKMRSALGAHVRSTLGVKDCGVAGTGPVGDGTWTNPPMITVYSFLVYTWAYASTIPDAATIQSRMTGLVDYVNGLQPPDFGGLPQLDWFSSRHYYKIYSPQFPTSWQLRSNSTGQPGDHAYWPHFGFASVQYDWWQRLYEWHAARWYVVFNGPQTHCYIRGRNVGASAFGTIYPYRFSESVTSGSWSGEQHATSTIDMTAPTDDLTGIVWIDPTAPQSPNQAWALSHCNEAWLHAESSYGLIAAQFCSCCN